MPSEIMFILSLSVLFPLLVGLARWRIIKPGYSPLLLLFILALLAEILMRLALTLEFRWAPGNNVYILAESILIPLQFAAWGYMRRGRKIVYLITGFMFFAWVARHVWPGHITEIDPFFRMFYSLVIVLLSINAINYLVIHEEKKLTRNPVFIICTGFIIFFSYQLVYEGIYSIVTDLHSIDTGKLNTAFSLINCVVNILYGIALLLVPARTISDWLPGKN